MANFGKHGGLSTAVGKANKGASKLGPGALKDKLAGGFGLSNGGNSGYSGGYGLDFGLGDEGGGTPFRDVITGGIFDILQASKPTGYDERASYARGIKNDLYGLRDTITSNKSLIQKTDEALQRIASIAEGVRVNPATTLEDKLKDLGYGIFHDFYERTMNKYGKKLEKVNNFFNRLGSIGSSFINIFGLNDNSIISNAKAGTSMFKA